MAITYKPLTQLDRIPGRAYTTALRSVAQKLIEVRWQSGYAEDCKSLYVGSIPARTSIYSSYLQISRP